MLLALVVALSMAAPAASPAAAAPTAAAKAKSRNADNDTVCIVEAPVGSHLPHRYCAPRAYWEARSEADRRALSSFYSGTPKPSGGGGSLGASTGASSGP